MKDKFGGNRMIDILVAFSIAAMLLGCCFSGIVKELLLATAWLLLYLNWFWGKKRNT